MRIICKLIATALLAGVMVLGVQSPSSAAPLDVEFLGRQCKDNGDTKTGVRIINNTNTDKRPSFWWSFNGTGFGTGWKDVFANSSSKYWVTIPAGRSITYFAVYPTLSSTTPIWERKNIAALDC